MAPLSEGKSAQACLFFLRGYCRFGRRCRYSHESREARHQASNVPGASIAAHRHRRQITVGCHGAEKVRCRGNVALPSVVFCSV